MTAKFDADGLDWDEAFEFCAVPCGRDFDDRETALAHIDRCDYCWSQVRQPSAARLDMEEEAE